MWITKILRLLKHKKWELLCKDFIFSLEVIVEIKYMFDDDELICCFEFATENDIV